MKEPLTLQQSKDEVAKALYQEDWTNKLILENHDPDSVFKVTDKLAELYRQSFIDSLRGKINAKYLDVCFKSDPKSFIQSACYQEILTLLNETK